MTKTSLLLDEQRKNLLTQGKPVMIYGTGNTYKSTLAVIFLANLINQSLGDPDKNKYILTVVSDELTMEAVLRIVYRRFNHDSLESFQNTILGQSLHIRLMSTTAFRDGDHFKRHLKDMADPTTIHHVLIDGPVFSVRKPSELLAYCEELNDLIDGALLIVAHWSPGLPIPVTGPGDTQTGTTQPLGHFHDGMAKLLPSCAVVLKTHPTLGRKTAFFTVEQNSNLDEHQMEQEKENMHLVDMTRYFG